MSSVLFALAAPAAWAESSDSAEPKPPEATSTPATAPASPFQFHGFLTQAWAKARFADGGYLSPTEDEVILGVPEDATTDYRTLALQVSYEVRARDRIVVQLSHRRLGDSPVREVEDDVELDWAFWQHGLGENTYLKVGRMPIPVGIFNEIRDVGTLLPFYRAPFSFYREGNYTSETIDGVVLGHRLETSKASLTFDVYGGGWDLIEFPPAGLPQDAFVVGIGRVENALGGRVWVELPDLGLAFAGGAQSYTLTGGHLVQPGTDLHWWDWHLSLDGQWGRFIARSEFRRLNPQTNVAFGGLQATVDGAYVQLGAELGAQWKAFLQWEKGNSQLRSQLFDEEHEFLDSKALAIHYAPRPDLVLKVEHHWSRSEQIQPTGIAPTPSGPRLLFDHRTATGGRQLIVSLSTSF